MPSAAIPQPLSRDRPLFSEILHTIKWTKAEIKDLSSVGYVLGAKLDGTYGIIGREMRRLVHNREVPSSGGHVIAFLGGSKIITCQKCGKSRDFSDQGSKCVGIDWRWATSPCGAAGQWVRSLTDRAAIPKAAPKSKAACKSKVVGVKAADAIAGVKRKGAVATGTVKKVRTKSTT